VKRSIPELPEWAKYEKITATFDHFKNKFDFGDWRDDIHKLQLAWQRRVDQPAAAGLLWPANWPQHKQITLLSVSGGAANSNNDLQLRDGPKGTGNKTY
jgi:hypothetical protein